MLLSLDPDRCCGSGMCALMAPVLFDQDARDGTGIVLKQKVPEEYLELASECIRNCPSGAISALRYQPEC